MIDYFSLALTHALLIIALLRLIKRDDVDREDSGPDDHAEAAAAENAPHPDTRAGKRKQMRDRANRGSSDA